MKKIIFLTVLICGLLTAPLVATTYRVNNKITSNPAAYIYSNIQAAHDAAYNGDTLMIDGTSDSYSGFTCTKKLVIKGPGYLLDENPGISANKLSAKISGQCSFNLGSNGSLIMGLEFSYNFIVSDDNIIVMRCKCMYGLQVNSENVIISECFIENSASSLYGTQAINLTVASSIIKTRVAFQAGGTGLFLNNIFASDQITIPTGFDMKNNILFTTGKANVQLPMLPDPDVCYNISIADHFGTANNNQANVAESSLFLGALSESTDGTWQLKAGSPAIGAGEGGIDCGAFGGPQPYILCGVPTGPVIYQLNVSSYSTTDNKLPVSIKVKSY
jgi:hypothetical protein